jgi:hypothetical protein
MRVVPRWLLLLGFAPPVAAQQVPVVTLSRPVAEFAEPFSEIVSIRELSDGRVIVVDGRELTVQLADFRAGSLAPIGRQGSGPGEYQWPQRLFAVPGDTTLLERGAAGGLLVITPEGKPGPLYDPNPPDAERLGRFTPRFGDARGRLYGQASPIRRFSDGRPPELMDSSAIIRLDRATGKQDTVGYLPLPRDPSRQLMRGETVMISRSPQVRAFRTFDLWTAGGDGRIAIVYHEPYRVDIIGANGVRVRGQPIPYARIRVDDRLKDEWRSDAAKPRMAMVVTRGSAAPSMEMVKQPVREPDEWPEFLPPFTSNAVSISPDGMIWVRRAVAAGAPPEYDIVDGQGLLVQKVRLSRRSHVVGFGNDVVYVVRMDEDDLQYLQRFSTRELIRQH